MSSQDVEKYTDEKNVPVVHNLKELVAELHKVFSADRINVEYVKALMAGYKSNPQDWKQYAKFDEFRYTRNLVDTGNSKLNLIVLCWGEGHGSSIHDHMDSHCFMKILHGELRETGYAWPTKSPTDPTLADTSTTAPEDEAMIQIRVNTYGKDRVAYINDAMGLHRVENLSHTEKAVSLHLYSPPFSECHTFDERTGYQRVAKVTFWSKYGERCPFNGDTNECSALPKH